MPALTTVRKQPKGTEKSPFFVIIMRVILLCHTDNPDNVVAAAARLCYSEVSALDLLGKVPNAAKLIADLRQSGHTSTFEHASFTFAIDGLSRVASHQLVRHRIASFSQQSQRYVKMNAPEVVTPPSIAANPEALALFDEQVLSSHKAYKKMVELGVPAEDARFVLPHGWETKLVLTMNARELHHFFTLRACRRAQWEIQALARKMLELVREVAPLIFEKAGPACVVSSCKEARPCGNPYHG